MIVVRLKTWDEAEVARLADLVGGRVIARIHPARTFSVEVPSWEPAFLALSREESVEDAAPDAYVTFDAVALPSVAATWEQAGEMWNHRLHNVYQAWKYTKGAGVRICTIDTALVRHQQTPAPSPGGHIAAIPDVYVGQPSSGDEEQGQIAHGLMTFSTINANGTAVRGIAHEATPMHFTTGVTAVGTATVAEGIVWATDNGADVISMSISLVGPWTEFNAPNVTAVRAALEYAWAAGVVMFSSAGNADNWMPVKDGYETGMGSSGGWEGQYHGAQVNWLGQSNRLMTVGGVGKQGVRMTLNRGGGPNSQSSRGPGVDVCASGGCTLPLGSGPPLSQWPPENQLEPGCVVANIDQDSNRYDVSFVHSKISYFGGTSCSCPNAAAAAALMLSVNPDLTPAEVMDLIRDTAYQPLHDHLDPWYMVPWATVFPAAGILNTGKAVVVAKSLNAANAGVRYPWFDVPGPSWDWNPNVTETYLSDRVQLTLDGEVRLEVGGYSSDEVTGVEILLGGEVVYSQEGGAPTVFSATASYDGTGTEVEVVVRVHTASGYTDEVQDGILVTSLAVPLSVSVEHTGARSVRLSGSREVGSTVTVQESGSNALTREEEGDTMPAGSQVTTDVSIPSGTPTRIDTSPTPNRYRTRVVSPEAVGGAVVYIAHSQAAASAGAWVDKIDPQFGGVYENFIGAGIQLWAYHTKGSAITLRLVEYVP